MYFVASEHIFRWGLLSKLIVFLQAPIARLKATADTSAVRQVLRRLQEGHSVCIFRRAAAPIPEKPPPSPPQSANWSGTAEPGL
jgi:hypothetical protein